MGVLMGITITLFIIISVFLILLILIQKGRGGGLASAFGGAGGNTAFGSKTGDVLTWATSVVFGVFVLLAVVLNLFANARQNAATTAAVTTPAAPVRGPLNDPVTPDPVLPAGGTPVERPATQP